MRRNEPDATALPPPPPPPAVMSAAEQRRAFAAAIFRRGQKEELFEDGEERDAAEELRSKLDDLHGVWALARSG